MKQNKPNMHDVAKAAGVSVATVSHTINNTRFVSEKSRAKVMRAIDELDYSPDLFARGMRTGKKNMIGFIVPDISNKYFARIIEEVEEIVSGNGYWLTIFNTQENELREIERLKYLTSGVVDGLLLASTLSDSKQVEELLPKNFPVVLVDRKINSDIYDSITIESYTAVRQGVKELVMDGHSKIGYIAGLPRLITTTERLRAYSDAMEECAVPVEQGFIQYGNSMAGSAIACVQNLLELGCTAMVVSNGLMSIDVVQYLVNKGYRIGEDIDLLCFNDSDLMLHTMFPMRVVQQPVEELGELAGKQILARIENVTSPIKDITLLSSAYSKPSVKAN